MLENLTIKSRVIISISFILLLATAGFIELFGMNSSSAGLKMAYEDRAIPLEQLGGIEAKMMGSRLDIANAIVDPTPETTKEQIASEQSKASTEVVRHIESIDQMVEKTHVAIEYMGTILSS